MPGGDPTNPVTRISAAALSVGEPVAVGGIPALLVHGLRTETERDVELWVPPGRRPTDMPGRVIRRSSIIDFDGIEQVDAIPVVAPAEAIAQLAATMPPLRLRHTAIDARFRGQLPDGSLEELVDIDPYRPGRAELRELAAR